MSGGGNRSDHWSTKEDPFRLPDEDGTGWSPPHGAIGELINLNDDPNGHHPQTGFVGVNPGTAPTGGLNFMDEDVAVFGTPNPQYQFQVQQQQQQQQPQLQQHGLPVGHGAAMFPVSTYPTYYSPNNVGTTNPGSQVNYQQQGQPGMMPSQQSYLPASSSNFGGGNWQQQGQSPMGWSNGGGAALPSNYGPEVYEPPQMPQYGIMTQPSHGGPHNNSSTGSGSGRKTRESDSSDIYTSDEDENHTTPHRTKKAKPSNLAKVRRTPSTVDSMNDLTVLGKLEILARDNKMHKYIETYVYNSSGMSRENGSVKIRQICQLTNGWKLARWPNKMMLWFKTTPGGVRHLGKKQDGCIAFYDRVARALAVKPEELNRPLRQIILLCTVSVENIYEDRQGYSHWGKKTFPKGVKVIKGVGRLEPVERENVVLSATLHGDTIIPCGSTRNNTQYKNYELEYSEYLAFEASRIKVDYAVDIELIPKRNSTSKYGD